MTGRRHNQTPSPPTGAGASFVPESLRTGATATPADLAVAGKRLFGAWGWQTRLAAALEVDGSTVRRWVSGATPIPNPVKVAIRLMLAAKGAGDLLTGEDPVLAATPGRPRSTSLEQERTGRARGSPV